MKLLLVGYGKMGQLVEQLAVAQGMEIASRIDVDAGDWSTPADVAIDFSIPDAAVENIEREFFDLFIGLGRGELLPYGSFYLTGFLHERPLARLRGDLAALGIERAKNIYEPEDHISILFEVMAGLSSGRLPAPAGTDRKIFERHIKPWAARFFLDLENAKGAKFYRRVGTLGRVFVEIEAEAFALAA